MDSFKMIVQRFMADLPTPTDGEDAETSGQYVIQHDSDENDAEGITDSVGVYVEIDSQPLKVELGQPPVRERR